MEFVHLVVKCVLLCVKVKRLFVVNLVIFQKSGLFLRFFTSRIPAQKPSYNSSPRKVISPSSSTAIKPFQSSLRNTATPRGVELASKKTGIAPRSVETPKYKANLTSSTYLSSSTRTPSTPVSKTINSRLTSSTSVPSSAYTVNRTVSTSPSYHPIPRKATNLSATPTRSNHGNETPEAIARLDRELERVPIEQKSQYSLFQRVRVRGTDGKLHLATVQFVGRTRGTKKIMYGVLYQDNYGPEGNGTYYVCQQVSVIIYRIDITVQKIQSYQNMYLKVIFYLVSEDEMNR